MSPPPEAFPPTLYREVPLGPGHAPTPSGPIKRYPLRPPVLRLPPAR